MSDEIVITDSIVQLSREDWDVLTENDVYGRYGWLKTVEDCVAEAGHPKYILRYREGRPLVAAVLYEYERACTPGRLADLLFGRAAKFLDGLGVVPRRTFYCGPIIGQGRHIFWNKSCSHEEASDRIRSVLDVIRTNFLTGSTTVVFGRIPDDEMELARELRNTECVESQTWPISYIDVEWKTFDDYVGSLADLGKNMRTKARRELAAPGKHGIRIESSRDFREDSIEIDELFRQTQNKYGTDPTPFDPSFVATLAINDPAGPIMNIARNVENGNIAGAALLLQAGQCAAGPLIGVEGDDTNRKAFTYFNLSLYAPIRYCLENRISRIYFGSGLTRLKQKRGCRQMAVYIFVLAPNGLSRLMWRCWMSLHRKWITSKSAREHD